MKISPELFLSILAMDSCNRGYGSGITNATNSDGETDETGLGRVGSTIGNATVIADNNSPEAQESSFYALAYAFDYDNEGNDETIISYRGTDMQPGLFPPTLGDAAMSLAI